MPFEPAQHARRNPRRRTVTQPTIGAAILICWLVLIILIASGH